MNSNIKRRDFLKTGSALVAGASFGALGNQNVMAAEKVCCSSPKAAKMGWLLGVQQYTFRSFSFFEMLDMMVTLGIEHAEAGFFLPLDKARTELKTNEDLSPAVRKEVRQRLADRGLKMSTNYANLGTDADLARKIFDFTKEMGADKGTGLGLSICHSIIKKHGGDIAVESKVNRGATMYVFLPSSKELIAAPAEPETPLPERAVAGKGKVLVMDDEERILVLAERMLQRLGYDAAFSRDGEEAISMYTAALEAGRPFDVVVLDLTVRGGMGGKNAIKELIRIDPGVKAVVSSGYSNDPVMADYRRYGFKGVVAKPYSLQELSSKLNTVISGNK